MNTFPVWSVSLHHALGGKPLWLVVCGPRNGPEAQSQATLAGHRLTRVLGGFSGHLSLDARWRAYYLRVHEVVIVATYTALSDGGEAMGAAGAARGALLEVCGRPELVTLAALAKCGAEVQLALRRAVSGHGRISGIGSSKFDLASVQLSPDAPPDDAASLAMRSANDVTSPAACASACDAWQLACSKSSALSEALARALRPSPAAQALTAPPRGTWLGSPLEASQAALRAHLRPGGAAPPPTPQPRRHARLHLVPQALARAIDAAEQRAQECAGRGAGGASSASQLLGQQQQQQQQQRGGGSDGAWGDLWAAGAAPASARGSFLTLPSARVFSPPSMPEFTLTLRLAAVCEESAKFAVPAGEGATGAGAVAGTCRIKCRYGHALPGEVEESGHGALRFALHFRARCPLEAVSYTGPGVVGAGVPCTLLPGKVGEGAVYSVPVALPAWPAGQREYGAGDLGCISYRFPASHRPLPLLSATALARTVHGAGGGEDAAPRHRHTDVLLTTQLHEGRAAMAATLVQLGVSLPALQQAPEAAGAGAPSYDTPSMANPPCTPQLSGPKPQLAWALAEAGSGSGSGGAEGGVSVASHFAAGKAAKFIARVPVLRGAVGGAPQPPHPQPLTLVARLTASNKRDSSRCGLVEPVSLAALPPEQQPVNADTEASGMALRVQVLSINVTEMTTVMCQFKA